MLKEQEGSRSALTFSGFTKAVWMRTVEVYRTGYVMSHLDRNPDERAVAVTRQHDAAHQASLGLGEPVLGEDVSEGVQYRYTVLVYSVQNWSYLGGGDGRGVDEGEAEAVQRQRHDGQGEVGLDGEEGQHEAAAENTSVNISARNLPPGYL